MKRNAMQDLLRWKADEERKPLVLKGARQVGKTWLMKEFGRVAYAGYVYFNFDEENALKSIFEHNKNPQRIIELLSLVAGEKIEPETTLIIFDEVQECPEALNALKYFKEKANEYHVIAAGSLLGTLLAQPKSYPVGMVNLLEIQPLTFDEFLEATDESLFRYYERIEKGQVIEEIFHKRLLDAYHNYLIIGGMPECVASWVTHHNLALIDQIHQKLVEVYEENFLKHSGKINSDRILMVFRSIAAQLAKPNEKFMYRAVRSGGRARDFEEAIEWLVSARIVNRVYNTSKLEHPLPAFDKLEHFKLFLFDTGLLKHMAGIDNSAILLRNNFQFKGPLTENYVLQQLRGQFRWPRGTTPARATRSTSCCKMGRRSSPWRPRAERISPHRPSSATSKINTPPTPCASPSAATGRTGRSRTCPLYLARKTKELL